MNINKFILSSNLVLVNVVLMDACKCSFSSILDMNRYTSFNICIKAYLSGHFMCAW